jgi:hypothetical protein
LAGENAARILHLYFLSLLIGFIIGLTIWFGLSTLVAYAIIKAESAFPRLAESRVIIAGEVVACLSLVLVCIGTAFWIAKVLSAR